MSRKSKLMGSAWGILFFFGLNVNPVYAAGTDPSAMGIGNLTESNQQDFERFQGAFYLQWSELSLANLNLQSDSKTYNTNFSHAALSGINLGVRHDITSFERFAILGDYSLGVNWMTGSFSSTTFKVSSSSNQSTLMSFGLMPKFLVAYFLSDHFQPIAGLAVSAIYSRLQSPLSGGNNEYMEFHYGPVLGLQVLNFPLKQVFFSVDWYQPIGPGGNDDRLFVDSGRAEVALGLNF